MRGDSLRIISIGIVIAVLFTIMYPGSLKAEAQPRACGSYGGIMVQAISGDPPHLNPGISTGAAVIASIAGIFESLLRWDDNMKPYPALAERWEVLNNGTTYIFYLVKNATWHDGTPFTAYDVKFTFEQILKRYHPRARLALGTLDRIDIINNYTVAFFFTKPNPAFLYILNVLNAPILPRHLLEQYVNNITVAPFNIKPVGTGPFKFVEWRKGEYIRVEKYDNYYLKGYPCLDAIVTRVFRDPISAVLALEKGEIHYIPGYFLPYSESRRLSGSRDIVVTSTGGALLSPMLYMMFNLRSEPLNNRDFRSAIAYAINKTEIVDKVLFGFGKEATSPIPSTHWAFTGEVYKYEYNPERAREILDRLGYRDVDGDGYREYPNGSKLSLEIAYNAGSVILERTAYLIHDMLRKIGIKTDLKPYDEATILGIVYRDRKFHITFERLFTAPDPAVAVARLFHSSFALTTVPYTNSAMGYNNTEVDKILDQAATTYDATTRKALYAQFQEIVMYELPVIPLAEAPDVSAYRIEVRNLHSWSAESRVERIDVWIQTQAQIITETRREVTEAVRPATQITVKTNTTPVTQQEGISPWIVAAVLIGVAAIVTLVIYNFYRKK
jgi:peptide/nickel transport system substrate-binding protein